MVVKFVEYSYQMQTLNMRKTERVWYLITAAEGGSGYESRSCTLHIVVLDFTVTKCGSVKQVLTRCYSVACVVSTTTSS